MSNIYNLTNEYNDLYLRLFESVNEETGEFDEELINALTIKKEELNHKTESLACIVKETETREDQIDKEIKRLQALKKRYGLVRKRIEDSILTSLISLGENKVEGLKATISFRKSCQTIIEDEELLPDEYKKVKITFEPKKTEIKKAIEQGINVPGARLEIIQNLQVK